MTRRPHLTLLTVSALLISSLAVATAGLVAAPKAEAGVIEAMGSVLDREVYGDFVLAGNTVLECAPNQPACLTSAARTTTGSNNNYTMAFSDVDGVASTYNSSRARFTIPAGTRVAYAQLNWSGIRESSTCEGSTGGTYPTGRTSRDPVVLTVGSGASTSVNPGEYTGDTGPLPGQSSGSRYYSAEAVVTSQFANVTAGAATTVTVANVFSASGAACHGGWALQVVYEVISPTCATPKRRVFIYDGHVRQSNGEAATQVAVSGFRVTDTPATVGVISYEGDAGITGDTLSINGVNITEPLTGATNNFFTSNAGGTVAPAYSNNYSVDAKSFSAPATAIKAGDTSATLALSTTGDNYLLQGVALSVVVPNLCITKTGSPSVAHPGDTITWTIRVENTSTSTITQAAVSDPLVPACARSPLGTGTLVGGQAVTYTCTSTAPADDIGNTATATGRSQLGELVNGFSTAPVEVLNPAIDVTKTVNTPVVVAGTTVTWTVEVTNNGDAPLSGVAVTDPGNAACTRSNLGSLAVGATQSYTCTGTINADTTNTVNARGADSLGRVVTDSASATVDVVRPAIAVTKSVSPAVVRTGGSVTYTIRVENTGEIALDNVTVDDNRADACDRSLGTVAVGAVRTFTCTVDNLTADVTNTAVARGEGPVGSVVTASSQASVDVIAPSLALTKAAGTPGDPDGNGLDAGDPVPYTFTVRNTGDVPITAVSVTDPLITPVTCPAGALAAGATRVCTGTYTLTQDDVDAGAVTNTARAQGTDPVGGTVTSPQASITTPLAPGSSLTLLKRAGAPADTNGSGRIDAGDTIAYAFDVTNAGGVTLRNLTVTDPLVGAVTCPVTTLAPGATTTCTAAAYTLTQADVDAGRVENTARANATRPNGTDVPSAPSSTTTTIPRAGSLVLTKTAGTPVDVDGSGLTDAGDRITYTFSVRNTGNVTVSGVSVSDPKLSAAGVTISCGTATLAPGATRACTTSGPYTITAADQEAGSVDNRATAGGTGAGTGPITSQPATTSTPVTVPRPALEIDKVAGVPVDVDGSGLTDAGDRITYSFTVRNTGNVPVTAVTVLDPKLTGSGLTISCGTGSLAPGATRACTVSGPYVVTAADETAGEVANSARARATAPGGAAVTSAPDTTSTPTTAPAAVVRLEKRATDVADTNSSGLTDAGDRVLYTFRLVNDGNVPLTAPAVSDPKLAGQSITVTCPAGSIAPGGSVDCTASARYRITADDEGAAEAVNTATGSARPPQGARVTDDDTARVPVSTPRAALTVDKTAGAPVDANGNGVTDAGDTIAYTFLVTNAGNVPVDGVRITDPMLTGAIPCTPDGRLLPGQNTTCATSTPYRITAADEAAGIVTNTARARGTDPDGGDVVSPTDTASVATTEPSPALVIDKQAGPPSDTNGSGITDAGDRITYTFVVTNTGNVPVAGVGVDDATLAAQNITVTCAPARLAPGASATCTSSGRYRVTAENETSGAAANTAFATGDVVGGGPVVSAPATTTTPVTRATPRLLVDKSAGTPVDVDDSGIVDAGDTIAYSFVVTNTGNVPVTAVAVDDPMLAGAGIAVTCATRSLAPGETTTCTAARGYPITADQEAAGTVGNSAEATATDPDGDGVRSAPDTTATPVSSPLPSLRIVKDAGDPVDVNGSGITDAGDTIEYTFEVTNTGNARLFSVRVDDPLLAGAGIGVTCTPGGPLAPGGTVSCAADAPYVVTAADERRGAVINEAVARAAEAGGDAVASTPDSTTTPVTEPAPRLAVVKEAATPIDVNGSGITDAGDTITFTFTVTNTGNVPVTGVAVDDPLLAGAGIDVACDPTTLAPGDEATCTPDAPYEVTEADETSGLVRNTATAGGTDPDGDDVTSTPDSTGTPVTQPRPRLTIRKTAAAPADVNGSGITDAGDTIAYSIAVTNAGNVPVTGVTVDDALLAGAGIDVACDPADLAPGETATCTPDGPYVVTEADEAAGVVTNRATAAATDPDGDPTPTTLPAEVSTPVTVPAPGLRIDKRAAAPVDSNDSGITDAGDTITYAFTVTNTGNVPLIGVTVEDAKLTGAGITVDCAPADLAPGEEAECLTSAPYVVTEQDELDGAVANEASAEATDPDDGEVTSAPDTTTTPVTAPATGLRLRKTAADPVDVNESGLTDAGDTLAYAFRVTNTGNVPLRAVDVSDPKLEDAGITLSCGAAPLAPGASVDCTVSGPYRITTADVATGAVTNVATAGGTDPDGDPVASPQDSTATPTTQPRTGLRVEKTAADPVDVNESGITDAGDTIAYTFTVTNAGNVPVRTVAVDDPLLTAAGITITCAAPRLAPGASTACEASGPYVVTLADEQAGSVANSATATGIDPDGAPVGSPPDTTSTPVTLPQPRLVTTKTAADPVDVDGNGIDAGDTIEYTFVVTNAGNVPLEVLRISDPMFPPAPGQDGIPCDAELDLDPGDSAVCTRLVHAITQAQVDAGVVVNTATALADDPDGDLVQSPPGRATTPLDQRPALVLEKAAGAPVDVNGSGLTDAGDTISFTFTVANTGNVTVSGVRVVDPLLADAGIAVTCTDVVLPPQESTACAAVAPYTVTAADVEAGAVSNTATAQSDVPALESPPASTATPTTIPRPGLRIDKSVAAPRDVNGSGITDAGDLLDYSFTVTNTGNVPLADPAVTDAMLTDAGITVTCPTPIPVGTAVDCTPSGPYTVTEADEDAGSVVNSATASATDPDGGTRQSDPDTTSTTVVPPRPALLVAKDAADPVDVNGSGITDAGDTIAFTITVTNTGNVPVTDVTVDDPLLADAGLVVVCDPTSLAPGEASTCTTDDPYVVTAADVAAGAVANTATASATDPDGDATPPSNEATTSTPTTRPAPTLVIEKTAGTPVDVNDSGITDAGDTIAYTFTVTNTGNVPVRSLAVRDELLAAAGITVSCDDATLAPGTDTACEADDPYVVTEADEAAGQVANVARAAGTEPDGGEVLSPTDGTVTPTTVGRPALGLEKRAGTPVDVNGSGLTDAGDTIAFTFTVTNTGNVPLRAVAIDDPALGIPVDCDETSLAPRASTECAARRPYVVTEADEAAGVVANSAVARGTDPDDTDVASPASATSTPTTAPQPRLVMEKEAAAPVDVNDSGLVDAGDTVAYTFTVTNAGNVPITAVRVADPTLTAAGLTVACTPTRLEVGGEATCTTDRPYRITAGDVGEGAVVNTATARGTDPDGATVTSPTDTVTVPVATPGPALLLEKTADTPVDVNGSGLTDAGDTIAYSFSVTNTGNVPLRNLRIRDALLADLTITCPTGALGAGATVACTVSGPYTVTAADVAQGAVLNSATALAVDPDGGGVTSPADTTATPTTVPRPGLVIEKTAGTPVDVNGSGITDAGDRVQYSFTVTSTGNVPLTGVTVVDPQLADVGIDVTCEETELAVGAATACSAEAPYRITPSDEQTGAATNRATADGTDPDGDGVVSAPDTTAVPTAAPAPVLRLEKSASAAVDVNDSGLVDAGDEITYTFEVTNTGNVPITGVAIVDDLLTDAGLTVICDPTTLAPGGVATCEADGPYVITEADESAGLVANSATATGTDPDGGGLTSPPSTTTTLTAVPSPGLELDKQVAEVVDVDDDGRTGAGDTVTYEFVVTNIGNTPVTAVTVDDPRIGAVTCPPGVVAVGESVTCTSAAPYELTQADADAGAAVNVATASATDPDGDTVASNRDSATVFLDVVLAIELDKQAGEPVDADGDGRIGAGDTIDYTFVVTNTGTVTVAQVAVTDRKVGTVDCPAGALAPGDSVTCTAAPYRIAPVDLANGQVRNTATASAVGAPGTVVAGEPTTSQADSTTTALPREAGISLDKRATLRDRDGDDRADVGERITYTFVVANTGTVPLSRIRVDDPMLTAARVAVDCPRRTLAAGATMTCRAVYTVTRTDVRGPLENTASVVGSSAVGNPTAEDAVTVPTDQSALPPGGGPGDGPGGGPGGGGGGDDGDGGDDDGGGFLPDTGGPGLLLLLLGLGLVLGGAGVLLAARRRRT